MSPISAIPPTMSSYGLGPAADVAQPDALPTVSEAQAPSVVAQPSEVTANQGAGDSFGNLLGGFISDVNAKQTVADQAVNGMQSGQNVSLHQAVIAMEEANVSFQLMVEVRNKLLDAYQEIMKMQI